MIIFFLYTLIEKKNIMYDDEKIIMYNDNKHSFFKTHDDIIVQEVKIFYNEYNLNN